MKQLSGIRYSVEEALLSSWGSANYPIEQLLSVYTLLLLLFALYTYFSLLELCDIKKKTVCCEANSFSIIILLKQRYLAKYVFSYQKLSLSNVVTVPLGRYCKILG